MRTLLIGPQESPCRDALESALRGEGHDVHLAGEVSAAHAVVEEETPPLVVLAGADGEALEFCRKLQGKAPPAAGGERPVPVVQVVAPPEADRRHALAQEKAVDDLIFSWEDASALRARITFAEKRVRQRAQAVAGLRRESERMRDIFESITDAFIAVDSDWRFTFVNQQAETLLDRRRDVLLGQSLWEAFPKALDSPFEEHYRRAMREGASVSFEAHYGPLETWFSVNAYPFEGGLSIYFDDVTERHEAERALRESEAKTRAVLETTVDAIITIDEEGCIESFNQAAEDIFGYAEDEVLGENIKILMPEPYRSEHDSYLQNYRETGRRKIIGIGREVEGRRKDGSVFPMDLAVSEVELDGRRIFTGIVRDISERRRLEREVLEISEEERRRIGQDLHDNLGQMLTGVGLLSRSLARKLEKADAPGAEEAAQIEQLIKEADEQARTLSRGLVPVDLEAKGLSDALRRLAGQTEELSDATCAFREAGTGAVHDNTAATHLYRIAQEATNNAVKHGRASHIAVMLASGPERIRLRVRDDGVGFPENEAEIHESQAGGLGVRTMHHRAHLIGATLDIQSTPGEGTAVTCTLRSGEGRSTPGERSGEGRAGGHASGGSDPGEHPGRNGAPRPASGNPRAARPDAPGCPVH